MKKRFWIIGAALTTALLVCAAVLFVLNANAEAVYLQIGGVSVTGANSDILGDGVFAFDGDHTLTVHGDHSFEGYLPLTAIIR